MSSYDIYYMDILNKTILYIYRYVVPILYILGNIGNILSIIVFFKRSWRKNVCVFYFKICLLINSSYINSIILGYIFRNGFNINVQNSNIVLCKLFSYLGILLSTLLPNVLICASIDRLLISSQNIDTRLYSSKRLAYFSISISTLFWILFHLHILIKMTVYEIYPLGSICTYDQSTTYIEFITYSSLIIKTLFCSTMILLLVLAFKNVRRIRAVPRQQRQQIRSMTKKDFQLLRCLFVQDLVYIVFTIFLNVYYAYIIGAKTQLNTPLILAINTFLSNLFSFLHHMPYCSSFYIFIIVSKAFRNELKRMIYKLIGKNPTTIREEDNRQNNLERDNIDINVISYNPSAA